MAGRTPIHEVLDDSMVPRPGDRIANKYIVERVVGAGGMGIVLAARHVQLDQRVAIKVLCRNEDPEHAPDSRARFFREGRAAAALHSDHAVKVYDVGVLESGLPYIVMELLEGSDLGTVLTLYRRFPVLHAVEAVIQAGDAIAEAHRRGIVHRDLKPSNLFVTQRSDGTPRIKVVDFGISKSRKETLIQGDLTSTRSMMGSPFYMSPEQIRDSKHVDHRSDIWSLGAILYELLSGHPPFVADTLLAACAAIVADDPRPLALVRDDVPGELEAVVLRCLEKDAAMRYDSVDELIATLQPFSAQALGQPPPQFDPSGVPTVVPPKSPAEMGLLVDTDGTASPTLASVAPERPAPGIASHTRARSGPRSPPDALVPLQASRNALSHQEAFGSSRQPTPWRRLGATLALGLLLLGGAWLAVEKRWQPPLPSVAAARSNLVPAKPSSFVLLVESTPTGSEVYENNERLGTTPLAIRIRSSTVASPPREFEVRQEGFQSHVFTQGVSANDVHRVVTLTREAPSSPISVEPSKPRHDSPVVRRRSVRRVSASASAPEASTSHEMGIRLNR